MSELVLPPESSHRQTMESEIKEVVDEYEVQPILFIGSGLSQRYFNAPNWEELLRDMGELCPNIDRPLEFYLQDNSLPEVGSIFAKRYREWAWELYENESGEEEESSEEDPEFPDHLYKSDDSSIYLKYKAAEHLDSLCPDSLEEIDDKWSEEIAALQEVQPHAIITTNYDQLLEEIFPDYNTIIGEEVLDVDYTSIGEIFKIHGCTSDISEIVLTEEDYDGFNEKKAYLSAKLLTYLSEHPVLIAGYDVGDRNINAIFSDLDRVLTHREGDLIPNLFHLHWRPDISPEDSPRTRELVPVNDERRVRLQSVSASSYQWPYEAFSEGGTIEGMTIKELRKLMGNTYDLITEEAPRQEIAFEQLQAVSEEENLAKIFGITPLEDQPMVSTDDDDADLSAVLDESGIPVDEALTTEPTSSIDESLTAMTKSWNSMSDLISAREIIFQFHSRRRELNLPDTDQGRKKTEFLFRSSVQNGSHGVEWLLQYTGDIDSLLERTLRQDIGGNSLRSFERILLVLGEENLLRVIRNNDEEYDYISSNAGEYADLCCTSVEERVREYTDDIIRFDGETHDVDGLLSSPNDAEIMVDEIIGSLLSEDTSPKRTSLRKAELCRLGAEISENDCFNDI